MRWRWPPWRRAEDHSAEARERLAQLEERDAEVQRLAHELRAVRRRNNFSVMVERAIARAPRSREEG